MTREIAPQISRSGLINVWNIFLNWVAVIDNSLVVIGAFLAAISNLPGVLGVVTSDRRIRPYMTIAGYFSAVIKIVEHAKLSRQLMLVRSDVLAEHDEGGIAVAGSEIPEHLIISAVLLDDVNYVFDRIAAACEG